MNWLPHPYLPGMQICKVDGFSFVRGPMVRGIEAKTPAGDIISGLDHNQCLEMLRVAALMKGE